MANANKQLELHLEDPSSARKFILTDWDVSPLHSDLLDDFIIKKPTHITLINFEISGKKYVHETMSMNFQPLCQNDTFALIDGGWAPPILAIKRAHIIIDRNVINEIKFRFDNGSIKPSRDDDLDWPRVFLDTNLAV